MSELRVLKAGWEWNPLSKHRNMPCICGSGKKTKRCHGMLDAVPTDVAEKLKKAIAYEGFLKEDK